VEKNMKIALCLTLVLGTCLTNLAQAHDGLGGGTLVNPQSLAADRDSAKLNFLASQARRNQVDPSAIQAARSIYYADYVWTKTDLKVCFWNGQDRQQREIMELANVWHEAVPVVNFNYLEGGVVRKCRMSDLMDFHRMSDIRISLDGNDSRAIYNAQDLPSRYGDWSYPGRAVAENIKFPTTMNLVGAVAMHQQGLESNYYFNVRHEFGHALSLVHEHQRSICKGWFNIKAIAQSTGWSEEFAKTQVDSINESSNSYAFLGGYDISSIMQYNFRSSWYAPDKPGQINPCRRNVTVDNLSDLDKIVVAQLYEPTLNDTAERQSLIAKSKQQYAEQNLASASAHPSKLQEGIRAALASFTTTSKNPQKITIQVYPHKADRDAVLRAVSNLGYPLLDSSGTPIRQISNNVNPTLRGDPTNSVFYTKDVPEQDVRYIAAALLNAGINLKSIKPYYPEKANNFTKRDHLVQIGSSVRNRDRDALTMDDVLTQDLPMLGPQGSRD
jgi:hypothetical protein